MNNIILIGRLTKDPELRYTQAGKAVCSFTLAVDRAYSGEKKETDFINIVVWNKVGENCAKYLSKGRKTAVQGRLQVRSYEDNNGQRRYVTEVIANSVEFLEWGEKKQEEFVEVDYEDGARAFGEGEQGELWNDECPF